jgi:hypothetical protein
MIIEASSSPYLTEPRLELPARVTCYGVVLAHDLSRQLLVVLCARCPSPLRHFCGGPGALGFDGSFFAPGREQQHEKTE